MNVNSWIEWAFQGVITGAIIYGVAEMKGLRASIDSLNIQLARIIEKTSSHEKEIDKHDERIRALETERK